jgi:hypothetical protein
MLKKFADLFFEATIGLARDYQRKSVELAKITAASYYLQGAKALRKHYVALFFVFFYTLTLVMTLVLIPVTLLILAPWDILAKMISVCVLGVVYAGISLYYILYYLSEERWLRFSGCDELIKKIAADRNGSKP